jgi:hypothetical protein
MRVSRDVALVHGHRLRDHHPVSRRHKPPLKRLPRLHMKTCVCCQNKFNCVRRDALVCTTACRVRLHRRGITAQQARQQRIEANNAIARRQMARNDRRKALSKIPIVGGLISRLMAAI